MSLKVPKENHLYLYFLIVFHSYNYHHCPPLPRACASWFFLISILPGITCFIALYGKQFTVYLHIVLLSLKTQNNSNFTQTYMITNTKIFIDMCLPPKMVENLVLANNKRIRKCKRKLKKKTYSILCPTHYPICNPYSVTSLCTRFRTITKDIKIY